jgi:hypothetical protein
VGEEFSVKIKLLGDPIEVGCRGQWNTVKPALRGPFNVNVERNIRYLDNALPEWNGRLAVGGDPALRGPTRLEFDGKRQGVFKGDTRPIRSFGGFSWSEPGFHFLEIVDESSGNSYWSNPVLVSDGEPSTRIYWGDPHWQSFFSDGIRCPEEMYSFARDEAFLDFGSMSDHVEALTDCQWRYFTDVTNTYNSPGVFATLVALEWTHHEAGHRNVYYRGDNGPALRCTDPDCDTLAKLWRRLDGIEAVTIPHHTANREMGADWSLGWNPRLEKAVEIYSCWGNSECPRERGNTRPIRFLGGEVAGQHVVDALKAGFRFGFVGGGDIHDGRPGDELTVFNSAPGYDQTRPQGFTAAFAEALTREDIYDSIKHRRTYAATKSRIYLDVAVDKSPRGCRVRIRAASEDGLEEAVLIRDGEEASRAVPQDDRRVIRAELETEDLGVDQFLYVRARTAKDDYAWSSPTWGPAKRA